MWLSQPNYSIQVEVFSAAQEIFLKNVIGSRLNFEFRRKIKICIFRYFMSLICCTGNLGQFLKGLRITRILGISRTFSKFSSKIFPIYKFSEWSVRTKGVLGIPCDYRICQFEENESRSPCWEKRLFKATAQKPRSLLLQQLFLLYYDIHYLHNIIKNLQIIIKW